LERNCANDNFWDKGAYMALEKKENKQRNVALKRRKQTRSEEPRGETRSIA